MCLVNTTKPAKTHGIGYKFMRKLPGVGRYSSQCGYESWRSMVPRGCKWDGRYAVYPTGKRLTSKVGPGFHIILPGQKAAPLEVHGDYVLFKAEYWGATAEGDDTLFCDEGHRCVAAKQMRLVCPVEWGEL